MDKRFWNEMSTLVHELFELAHEMFVIAQRNVHNLRGLKIVGKQYKHVVGKRNTSCASANSSWASEALQDLGL